jgi:hypothetical protein
MMSTWTGLQTPALRDDRGNQTTLHLLCSSSFDLCQERENNAFLRPTASNSKLRGERSYRDHRVGDTCMLPMVELSFQHDIRS